MTTTTTAPAGIEHLADVEKRLREDELPDRFDADPAGETDLEPLTIQQRFEEFHAAHPWVATKLVSLARQGLARGETKLGIGMLWEVLRWETLTADDLQDVRGAKLNNDYRSRYARMLMDEHDDLVGVFDVRGLRAH